MRTDLGEGPLGSFLWLLERAPLVAAGMPIEQWAQSFAIAALSPLQKQGAVAQITCDSGVDTQNSRVWVHPRLYAKDGTIAFEQQFELAWQQLGATPALSLPPTLPPQSPLQSNAQPLGMP